MSTTYRVLSDQLYRSVALVTTSNVVTEAYDTDAYGNTLCYSGPGTDSDWFTDDDVQTHNPINTTIFTGRQYDPESQIYWYRARYYSPQIGRFISRDPIGTKGGINLYGYVGDNSANYLDPKGMQLEIGGGGDAGAPGTGTPGGGGAAAAGTGASGTGAPGGGGAGASGIGAAGGGGAAAGGGLEPGGGGNYRQVPPPNGNMPEYRGCIYLCPDMQKETNSQIICAPEWMFGCQECVLISSGFNNQPFIEH